MIDIENILSSISDEDMEKIKGIADSLINKDSPQANKSQPTKESILNLPIDAEMMKKIMSLMGQFNKDDYRTRLIEDLKPMLSDERKQKAEQAIKFLQLMEILPLLKGLF